MDIAQLARMIEWLDEERRRDKAKIAKMEEQIVAQQELVETMTRRMNGIETEQVSIKGQFVPVGRDAEILEFLREEMRQSLDSAESKRIAAEREAERRGELAREAIMRPLREMGDRMDKLDRLQEDISVARVERDRIANILAGLQQRLEDLQKKFEEPERRLAFLEEQRRQDSRRISEIQSDLPEMQKQVDGLRPKFDLVESLALRNEKLLLDMQASDRERQERAQQFIEQQTLAAQQRDARVEEIRQGFSQYEEEMRKRFDRFESWSEAYRQMKKIVEDFERIGDRLDRRINEVAEMQRLSEERFRQEWSAWGADEQKRFKQFTLTNDEAWRIHDKAFEELRGRVAELGQMFPPVLDSLERLWSFERGFVDMFRDRLPALLGEYEQPAERPSRTVPPVSNGGLRITQSMRPVSGDQG